MELKDMSIRARVAFGIECLEALIAKESNSSIDWQNLLLNHLWEYTSSTNLGEWHYLISEYTPFSVLENIPFIEKECEYISESEHNNLHKAYQSSSKELQRIVDLIFEIGTLDLYSSITDNSPRTLSMVQEISLIIDRIGIKLPSLTKYGDYLITDENGWGSKFKKSDITPTL